MTEAVSSTKYYDDYFTLYVTMVSGRVMQRFVNQADLDMIFGEWPDIQPCGHIDFHFSYPGTLPLLVKIDQLESVEAFRVVDFGEGKE